IQAIERQASKRRRPELIQVSTVAEEEVEWLWTNRIARGKFTLVVGDPGVSKSTLTADMMTHVTRGTTWPGGGQCDPGNVVMLAAEDGLADTTKPRLRLAGADMERVYSLQGTRCGDRIEELDLNDIPIIEEAVTRCSPLLVVVDPI